MKEIQQKELEKQRTQIIEAMSKIKKKLIVISGKGGVGKTTIAVNLSYGLAMKGYKVGILDVDIHGPNVVKMLGATKERLFASDCGIEPLVVFPNLKVVSMALVSEDEDQPIIWRGPLKMAVIRQFLGEVNWGNLDYLIIDSPPGTGDEPLSVFQLIPSLDGAIVVTTPQEVAILDVRKSILFAKELKVKVLGIIENMSFLVCPHCKKEIHLFGQGKTENVASEMNVPFLGRIPMDVDIVKFSDEGKPFIHFKKDLLVAKIMEDIIEKVISSLENDSK